MVKIEIITGENDVRDFGMLVSNKSENPDLSNWRNGAKNESTR